MSKGQRAHIRRLDGTTLSGRNALRKFGTSGWKALAAQGIDAKPVARRARYFAFRGTRQEQKLLLASIAHLIQPYPRRRLQEPPERVEPAWAPPDPPERASEAPCGLADYLFNSLTTVSRRSADGGLLP